MYNIACVVLPLGSRCKSLLLNCFCMIPFFPSSQDDLDAANAATWNNHLIRPTRNATAPSGRLTIMYHLPRLYMAPKMTSARWRWSMWMHANESVFPETIYQLWIWTCTVLASAVMAENNGNITRNATEAAQVYLERRQEILAFIS